jgi:hypothetical protein
MSDKKSVAEGNELYGKSDVDSWVDSKDEIYQIKNEINKFGITDKQRYFLLYVLAMELESVENSRSITKLVLSCCSSINILHDIDA